ncbi:MAG: DUF6599 family protein [Terriglobales bacterium]
MIANSTTFRSRLLIGLCLTFLGVTACHRSAGNSVSPFPASNEAAGWARAGGKTGEIRTFAAADLWKYIDGEAERYLKAGVESVSTADYEFRDKFDAVVDIYTMGNAAGAEKIFDSEPAANADTPNLGDSARLYSQSLVFRKGPYLVRITAYEDSTETKPALLGLARSIEQRLGK